MATIACSKDFTLKVNSGCVDWDAMTWTPPTIVGPAVIAASFSQGGYHILINAVSGVFDFNFVSDAEGTVLYTGDGCNCNASMTFDKQNVDETGDVGFTIHQDAVEKVNFRNGDYGGAGVVVFPFAITAGVNSVIKIRGRLVLGSPVYSAVVGTNIGSVEYTLLCTNV